MLDRWLALVVAVPFVLGMSAGPDAGHPRPLFRFQDPAIVESSGLVVLPGGLVVTVNDSGDSARVFVVDPRNGRTVGTTTWAGEVTDVESLAPAGGDQVWVGDTGDNLGNRDSVRVTRVPVGTGDRRGALATYALVYPHHHAYDAETLLAQPDTGRLYVVTKGVLGGRIYAAPRELDPDQANLLRPVADAPPLVTDGTFTPDGRRVLLRDYGRVTELSFPGWHRLGSADLPDQRQGEGIAIGSHGRLVISSEGRREPVYAVADPWAPPTSSPSPAPSDETTPMSREGQELPESEDGSPSPWGWYVGGGLGVVALLVLIRALRPR